MAQKIIPNLWFDTEAEQAADFYLSVFKDGRVIGKSYYPEGSDKAGMAVTVEWEVMGMRFVGINGGPNFKFDEAVSFQIDCEDQAEIDYYWDKLTAEGGQESMCGWCKDKFGLSWQVVPKGMDEMLYNPDREAAQRGWNAMMEMRKIDLAALHAAAEGVPAG